MLFSGQVGVVPVIGMIEQARPVNEVLVKFRRNPDIKAIVLRVDSGGGGVGASQEIYREVARTSRVKPVVGSMGGVAASGGYYIMAPCSKIVASPGTLTVSIGVIGNFLNAEDLFKKLGLKVQTIKSGALKGAGMPNRPLTEEQRRMLQEVMDDSHNQFVDDVAKARGLDREEVARIAHGGVFLASRAKKMGLVDSFGNFQDAVALAAKLGGIKGRPEVIWPQKKKSSWLLEFLLGQARLLVKEVLADLRTSSVLQYRWQPPDSLP